MEKSIIILECGKVMKVLTTRHLAIHGPNVVSYREKCGLNKGTLLTCKELHRTRHAKMKGMKIWEKKL